MASHLSRYFVRNFSCHFNGPWNFISGKRVDPIDCLNKLKVLEPATGGTLCSVLSSGEQEVDRAVTSALSAFEYWNKLTGRERGKKLLKAGELIRQDVEEIAFLEVKDTGKPIWEARSDILSCADCLEYYGGLASSITGEYVPLSNGSFAFVQKEPLGVIGGIGAWNFPMQTCTWKVAPALACGNTFVYKPSEYTPVTAVILGEILKTSGIPDGVYNVIQGDGNTGSLLCKHPKVSKLSLTGSVPTGSKVLAAAAHGIKYVTLELGGKSPLIIFDDAHMKNALKATLMANFLSQGQVCSNGTRVYVHKNIYEEFAHLLVKATEKLKIGNPFDETTTVGATINASHAEKVLGYIKSGIEEGANLLCGGERVILPGEFSDGWYLSPAVLSNCKDNMKVAKDEIFGSVLSLFKFESEEEVIQRANNSNFGLAGGVFTRDIQRGHRVAACIQAGSVWINTYNLYPPELPFGGFKESGIGRENGNITVNYYTQTKTTYVEMGDVDCGLLYQDT